MAASKQSPLTREEISRYSRHLLMPEVGIEGQRRLKSTRMLCVGIGGLGSAASMYLAAAGVGTLGIVDCDEVDVTNLQRQVIYATPDVGRPKLETAAERLRALNPLITIVTHEGPLTSGNAFDIIDDYGLVVDGTDNFPARYLINDACVLRMRPYVYGSVFRLEGQVSVFATPDGPCYRCLYPEPPPPGLVPSCSEAGVLGVLPGIIGTIQAAEAIKLVLGLGDALAGRILILDALTMRFREVRHRRDPDCPVCGSAPSIHELGDYAGFCGLLTGPSGAPEVAGIGAVELSSRLSSDNPPMLIDVRHPPERDINGIPGALAIPITELMDRLADVPRGREIVVFCRHGDRSAHAVIELNRAGFRGAKSLRGGMRAWVEEVDRDQPTY